MKRITMALAIAAILLGASSVTHAQAVTALPSVDLNRFTGTWYEIARLPNKREKKCIADVVEVLALGDKSHQLQIVSSCKTNKGYTEVRNASAKGLKGSGDGELKVTYLWPFHEKHWVLALGPDYEWALIGSPNHKTLWLLSRSRSLGKEVIADAEQKAAAQGFVTAKLAMNLQTGGQTSMQNGNEATAIWQISYSGDH